MEPSRIRTSIGYVMGEGCRENSGRLNGLSVITYLDLAFGDILGLWSG